MSEEVRASEPDTLQYQVTQSDEDENEILIWEEVRPKSSCYLIADMLLI